MSPKPDFSTDRQIFTMLAVIIVSTFSLANMGCSAAGQRDATGDPFVVSPAEHTEVWLPVTSPLYAAQRAWGLPAVATPILRVVSEAAVEDACDLHYDNTTAYAQGCTDFDTNEIFINNSMDFATTEATKVHELGHYLARKGEHIDSPLCVDSNALSPYIMCAYGATLSEPTKEDFDWALNGGQL